MNDFISIIQSVGFPIAVAVAMFIMLQNEQKEHKAETERITETLNRLEMNFNNTQIDIDYHFAIVVIEDFVDDVPIFEQLLINGFF